MTQTQPKNLELRNGSLIVGLTDDAYDYNDAFYTLEVTDSSDEENDAVHSGLPITASEAEIDAYLQAAMDSAQEQIKLNGGTTRRTASTAAAAGYAAIAPGKDAEERLIAKIIQASVLSENGDVYAAIDVEWKFAATISLSKDEVQQLNATQLRELVGEQVENMVGGTRNVADAIEISGLLDIRDSQTNQDIPLPDNELPAILTPLMDVEYFISAAEQHGLNSEPDHEVGDLQDFMRSIWEIMSDDQKRAFMLKASVISTLEGTYVDENVTDCLNSLQSTASAPAP